MSPRRSWSARRGVCGVQESGRLDVTKLALVVAGFIGRRAGGGDGSVHPPPSPGGHHEHLGHEPTTTTTAPGTWRRRKPPAARHAYALVGALSNRIPEGLAIGAGFAVPGATRIGIILAIAVGVQNACEGIVMAAPLRASGMSPRRGLVIVALTG